MDENYLEAMTEVVLKIKNLIGDPAIKQAEKVGLEVEGSGDDIEVIGYEGDGKKVLSDLYDAYKSVMGPPAKLMCKRALKNFSDEIEVPDELV